MLENSFDNSCIEAGVDEAGRGCLAGSVFAAAVVLPKDYFNKILNDSKKLSEKKRNLLRLEIEKEALAFGVGICTALEIDEINILNASFLAMHRALDVVKEKVIFESIAVDGNRFNPYQSMTHHCIIKGDAKYLNIAAASILAKTYRDEYMLELDKKYPNYDWKKNKGYPTKYHREAIRQYGISEFHRKSFKLLP